MCGCGCNGSGKFDLSPAFLNTQCNGHAVGKLRLGVRPSEQYRFGVAPSEFLSLRALTFNGFLNGAEVEGLIRVPQFFYSMANLLRWTGPKRYGQVAVGLRTSLPRYVT